MGLWTHQDEIQSLYEKVYEKCCNSQNGRNERGQSNYILEGAKRESQATGEGICDILARWMKGEKEKGKNADSCFINDIKKAQKAAGCRGSNK